MNPLDSLVTKFYRFLEYEIRNGWAKNFAFSRNAFLCSFVFALNFVKKRGYLADIAISQT